ncbi:MAG: penicillin-binding transpeptidase domain-containing protein [bacterium]|nr:penicillin-binding transpeptidase domain-containing protein [bacterium]
MNKLNAGFQAFRRHTVRIACFVGLTLCLTACEAVTGLTGGGASAPAAPILQVSSPADVVNAFFAAWNTRDYDAMYGRISSRSQSLITQTVFREIYEQVDDTIRSTGVTAAIVEGREQGTSAVVTLNVEIASSLFGTIPDQGRTMRLVRESGGGEWRIAWSQLDIFDGYAPGATLQVGSTREPRGHIFDRNGNYLVEQGGTVVELYVTIQNIPDYPACLNLLATLTLRQVDDVQAIFNDYNPETTFSIGDIDQATYDVNAGALAESCAITTGTRQTRRYAGHGMAAHVIGYIGQIPAELAASYAERGYNAGDLVGNAGVEFAYEDELAGSAERVLRIIEPGGVVIRELGGASGSAPQDVTLTLDLAVQRAAMQAMTDAFNTSCAFNENEGGNWGCRSPGGAVAVIDVNSGAILAMASFPTFDPSAFAPDTSIFQGQYINYIGADPELPQRNRATQDQYSPGSTFKIITTAAAAAERIFSPTERFDCQMEWRGQAFGDTQPVRFDWRNFEPDEARFPTGSVTMSEALAASCNPFFYQMGALLYDREPTTLVNYARRMGLGGPTGLDPAVFPAEAGGQLPAPAAKDANISIAIGQQDTQVSVIQMARMVASVANGGILYRPYVVAQVGGAEGTEPSFMAQPQAVAQTGLSEAVLDVVRDGMCMVTRSDTANQTNGLPFGTAWFVFDNADLGTQASYTVCGKTGTAQTGRIEPHGWFVAYAPADNPQIAVAGVIENSREGSETAAPIIRRIMDAYFNVEPAPFPAWWYENAYVELQIPQGSTGG